MRSPFARSFRPRTSDSEADSAGIRAGRDHEIVFHLSRLSMPNQVDARIHAGVAEFLVIRNARMPLRSIGAGQVVGFSGNAIQPNQLDRLDAFQTKAKRASPRVA